MCFFLENPNKPELVLQPAVPLVCLEYNPKVIQRQVTFLNRIITIISINIFTFEVLWIELLGLVA